MKIQTMPQLATLNASSNGCCHNEFLSNALAIQIEDINGSCIDGILCATHGTSTTYHHHDGLGSVILLTNASGSVVERYRYDVFGHVTILDATHAPREATAHNNRFLFTGREWLAELELSDSRNRTYCPTLGRFLQTDPIRFDAGDVNLYRYVKNNPSSWIDSFGLRRNRLECECKKKGGKWMLFWECYYSSLQDCLWNNSPTSGTGRAIGIGIGVTGVLGAQVAGPLGVGLSALDWLVGAAQCGSGVCCFK